MKATSVYFHYVEKGPIKPSELGTEKHLGQELANGADNHFFKIAPDPEAADLIVLFESAIPKDHRYVKVLLDEPLLRRFWKKTYCINYEDKPAGLLKGLYTSINQPFYNPRLHKSWTPMWIPCAPIYGVTDSQIANTPQKYQFSFLGSKSHTIRREILVKYPETTNTNYCVVDVDRWFNHSENEKEFYVNTSLQSKFVLCPRGHAPFSYRICETMALGRTPVIIADKWVPFAFEEKFPYYIRIAESDVERIPSILAQNESRAAELGANARKLWKKYSTPGSRIVAAMAAISEFPHDIPGFNSYQDWQKHWRDKNIACAMSWTLSQRLMRKARNWIRRLRFKK